MGGHKTNAHPIRDCCSRMRKVMLRDSNIFAFDFEVGSFSSCSGLRQRGSHPLNA